MNWKDWLLPWRAKAKIEELQACLSRGTDGAPFAAKIALLEDRLEQTTKSLKAALDEKHTCATLLSSTRASEQDWRETASKIDLEKNELASLNRTLVDQLEHAKADVDEWKGKVKTERKQREDMEVALGKVEAELHEAHALAAKASELKEALDNEVKEHREAKQQLQGLTKWIRTTHRLDNVAPKGSIRNILQTSRFKASLVLVALLCVAGTAVAQAPFWRNPWSTNQAPPVIGTNLWISNTASGDGWFFYNQPNSNVVARLRDITNAFTGLSAVTTNFNGINVTNRALIGDLVVTNSGNTTNLTNWGMQVWKSKNNLGAFDDVELDVSTGLAEPSWTLGYANSQPTIRGQVVVGNGNDVNGGNSTVLGISNYVSSTKTHIVVGSFSQAWGGNDGVVGHNSFVTNANNYAFGNNITNITPYSVCIGPHDTNKVRISAAGLDAINLPVLVSNAVYLNTNQYIPTGASLLNRSTLFNSNNVTFLENSYDGVNVNAITFSTNGTTTVPGSFFTGGSIVGGFNIYANPVGVFSWNAVGAATINRIGNGVSILPGIGIATNAFQVCNSNGLPTVVVTSNGVVGIGTNAMLSTAVISVARNVNNVAQVELVNGTDGTSSGADYLASSGGAPATDYMIMGHRAPSYNVVPIWSDRGVLVAGAGTKGMVLDDRADQAIIFAQTGTERARINSGGNVGIGTNNPQSALHVQGAQAELLRVDTISGGTGALTVSSNPVVRIRTEQATNQPIGCYGAMMMPLTNILAIGPTAYTNINGYSVLNTNWFSCNTNTGTISNVFAGYYRINISASILANNNDALEGCFLTNGVDSECISFYKVYDAAARFDVLSASGLLYLPTNCQCSFGLKLSTAGNVAIRRAAIVIGTP